MFSWWKQWLEKKGKKRKRKTHKHNQTRIKETSQAKEPGATVKIEKGYEQKQAREDKTVAALITDSLKLLPSNYQHAGMRDRQEDAFAFSDFSDNEFVNNTGVLAVVADGMGGLAHGNVASQTAVNVFLREHNQKQTNESFLKFLHNTLQRSNAAVYDLAFTEGVEDEIGTTLVAAVVHNGKMHWVSVGDSRIYLYRNNQLEQLNKEHIYANKLLDDVKNGLISKKEADKHPERSYLTSYLGVLELTEIDYNEDPVNLKAGDVVMLCSDGLTNTLTDKEIAEIITASTTKIAEELVKKALSKNNLRQDNITILVFSCKSV